MLILQYARICFSSVYVGNFGISNPFGALILDLLFWERKNSLLRTNKIYFGGHGSNPVVDKESGEINFACGIC